MKNTPWSGGHYTSFSQQTNDTCTKEIQCHLDTIIGHSTERDSALIFITAKKNLLFQTPQSLAEVSGIRQLV